MTDLTEPDPDPLTAQTADVLARVLRALDKLATDQGVSFAGIVYLPDVNHEDPDRPGHVRTANPQVRIEWDDVAAAHIARQLPGAGEAVHGD